MRSAARFFGKIRFIIPIIMLIAGWFYPPMHQSIFVFPWPPPGELMLAVAIEAVVLLVWIIIENASVADMRTTVHELKRDDSLSLYVAIGTTLVAGYFIGNTVVELVNTGKLIAIPWWLPIPWIGAVVDAWYSGQLAINNAAQKPITQPMAVGLNPGL